ncbi:MAG: hypothetical protein DID92_2727743662 [Candidatus Nitrotoga sp. SPKER]|nr:MAG: hypothetical protein DID92_2727743662 [Candidatus Nitrotoga sp. SPKER]
MLLDNERESENIEDRRGGGGLIKGVGIGGILLALVGSYLTGVNPATLLGLIEQTTPAPQVSAHKPAANDKTAVFVSKILAETEDTWSEVFAAKGKEYHNPKLVLFTGSTTTACGNGAAAMGPFYCPLDSKIYIDLSFFSELQNRFHAPGEFAQAYVLAHEVGHHVQNLLGISAKVNAVKQRASSKAEANAASVKLELQADCFAGVWARRTDSQKHILEPGEIEQAIAAATAIGDDALQKKAVGYAVPESFTHGSSEQRVGWFKRGMQTGDPAQCNLFAAN